MTTETLPTGPDPEAIKRTILETWPETDLAEAIGAMFFSLDPETTLPELRDDRDDRRTRRGCAVGPGPAGVFRLNIGVGRETFERLVGSMSEPDYAAVRSDLPAPCLRQAAVDLDHQPE